jgi:purine nucleoside phosphorylase
MAHEIGVPYANMSLVTDYDCWKEDEAVVSFCLMLCSDYSAFVTKHTNIAQWL